MSGIEKVPSTPSSPTKSVSLARRSSNMSFTNPSRPASSSSASAASFSAATSATTTTTATATIPPIGRPLSRANTTPLGISASKSFTTTTSMGPPPTPMFAPSTTTTPTTPTTAVRLTYSSSDDSPKSARVVSTITPAISIANITEAAKYQSESMSRQLTPPVSSMLETARAKGTRAAAESLAQAHSSQPRTLKDVIQTIIDSAEEMKLHHDAMDNSDDMLLEISELRGQLEAANAEFRAYREHMNGEMTNYKQKKETELRAFKAAKEKELLEFKTSKTREIDEYKGKKDQEVKGFKAAKEHELDTYKMARAKELDEFKAAKAREMAEFKAVTVRELDELKASQKQRIDDAVRAVREEAEEAHRQAEDELIKVRTERDTAVFTKESLMSAFEARYAEWDSETRKSSQAEAHVATLEGELAMAKERIAALTASLAELTAVHEQCAVKDRDFQTASKGLSAEVAALMVKAKLKTKEANEQRKQAAEYKKRYEKSQGRLGMLTLDTKDIGAKFRDLDNSVHDLAWNFFGREIPDPAQKLSSLPGNLWNMPTVASNSKAAQCLRSALAEALISHQLTVRIFQQLYLPHIADLDFDEVLKMLSWMDHEHPEQAQVIRCQLAMVTERFPEINTIPHMAAAHVSDILAPWLDLPDARKNFQDGLTNLMQRAIAIWQQMQHGSSLARAVLDSSEHQWIAADDARDQYNDVALDDDAGHKQQQSVFALSSPEYNQPIAVLFPQIYFGLELCFSGHALFASQSCVIAGYAERNSAPMPVNTSRRRTSEGLNPPPSTSSSGPMVPLPNNLMGGSGTMSPAPSMPAPNSSMPMERGCSSAASMTGVRPPRSSSRHSTNRIAQDFMKKLSGRLRKKGSRQSFQSTANDSGIGTLPYDHTDAHSTHQGRTLGRLTRSSTQTE